MATEGEKEQGCKNNIGRAAQAQALRLRLTLVRTESAHKDLRWLGRRESRWLLREAQKRLAFDPVAETRNMKTLRDNPIAQRELRLYGKFRILFNVNMATREVTLVVVGRKRGNTLFVQGRRFTGYQERAWR